VLAGEGSFVARRIPLLFGFLNRNGIQYICRLKKNFFSIQLCFEEFLFNIRHTLRNGSKLHLSLKLVLCETRWQTNIELFIYDVKRNSFLSRCHLSGGRSVPSSPLQKYPQDGSDTLFQNASTFRWSYLASHLRRTLPSVSYPWEHQALHNDLKLPIAIMSFVLHTYTHTHTHTHIYIYIYIYIYISRN
jgi:hypothetical protein